MHRMESQETRETILHPGGLYREGRWPRILWEIRSRASDLHLIPSPNPFGQLLVNP